MHVISKGVNNNSALKARKPHADFHQFQVIRHNQCRHRLSLSPLDSQGGCELLLDGRCWKLLWFTQNSGCVVPVRCTSTLYIQPIQVKSGQQVRSFPWWGGWVLPLVLLVWKSRGEAQGEGIKYDLANTAGPANACTAALTKWRRKEGSLPSLWWSH